MAYLFKKPTEDEFANGRALLKVGAAIFAGSLSVMLAVRLTHDLPLPTAWQYVVNIGVAFLSFGIGTILWGLRVHARQIEFDSVTRRGGTPAYEAACTMIAIMFFVIPIVWGLVASGIISSKVFTPPSAR